MFIPNGVQLTDDEKIDAVNKKQIIQHSATRLECNPFGASSLKTATNTLINTSGTSISIGNTNSLSRAQATKVFDLIKTPSPRPGEAFSPLMTWVNYFIFIHLIVSVIRWIF